MSTPAQPASFREALADLIDAFMEAEGREMIMKEMWEQIADLQEQRRAASKEDDAF